MPIHKKSSRRKCGNYRGISLLSIPGKVFARILSDRVKQLTYNRLLEEQAGFRSSRGCTDHIFIIRQLVEKHLEKEKKMFAALLIGCRSEEEGEVRRPPGQMRCFKP